MRRITRMRPTDYRETFRLLNTALALLEARQLAQEAELRRRLSRLALKADLLRARLRQSPPHLQRN